MRDRLPLSELYEGVGILETPFGYLISLDKVLKSIQFNQSSPSYPIVDSAYDLTPKGTFDNWFNMYIDEVKGHLLLELAVIFGISALVTSFLKHKHEIEFAGIIFSFTGQSSTGKSTAAALAVSVAGNPTKGNETLFRSWNATRNALEGYLSNNFGIPIVFDELSSATFKDTTGYCTPSLKVKVVNVQTFMEKLKHLRIGVLLSFQRQNTVFLMIQLKTMDYV